MSRAARALTYRKSFDADEMPRPTKPRLVWPEVEDAKDEVNLQSYSDPPFWMFHFWFYLKTAFRWDSCFSFWPRLCGTKTSTPGTPSASADGTPSASSASLASLVTRGSLGHPQLCQRPCIYFIAGPKGLLKS